MLKNQLRTYFSSLLSLFVLAHFTHHLITAVAAPPWKPNTIAKWLRTFDKIGHR